jgi:oligosaccharyltransferase complex subunit alpha (ribophorin I)
MFGGWKTQWYQGYNVPSSTYLSTDGAQFVLKVPFGVPFETVTTDKIQVRLCFSLTAVFVWVAVVVVCVCVCRLP